MATLFQSSIFLPFSSSSSSSSSHKLFLSPHHHHLNWNAHEHPLRNHFTFKVSASSSANKSSRSGRKAKSNEELCNDIREFLSTVGLPNDHVPTMKELSDHGRSDLANIVRRRGYKLVRELLASPTKTDFDGFIAVKGLADNVYGIVNESDAEESEEVEHSEYSYNQRVEAAGALNGSALTAKQSGASATVNHPLRDDHWATEAPINADFDSDFDVETSRVENELEINHLKFMLKEMELSQLKEQIEKEQHALSVLQTKAETEINKAQKLISEKDAELQAVEETLSGLEEVQIQYSGDGEIVELAGSFNGWHQRVKMDPQPSSSIIEPIGPRKSRHWSTVLWLYPGIYEIKFIVDGQWRIDPQRESVTRGGILNNILRVDR